MFSLHEHRQRMERVLVPGWWSVARHWSVISGWLWSRGRSKFFAASERYRVQDHLQGHTISLARRARAGAHATAAPFHQLVAPSTKTTTMASLTTVLQMTLYRPIVLT
jgi:hypothetical protein